jgi:hypothetical protein
MATLERRRIADQLDRAVNGPAWHGPAILKLVKGVSAKDAASKSFVSVSKGKRLAGSRRR